MKYTIIDFFSAHDIALDEQDAIFHANAFETIGRLTHNKLSLETMIDTFTFALRILEYCPNEGRMSCIMTLMDLKCLPEELEKLNHEEKEKFAFCIEYVLFMKVLGEMSGNVQSRMHLLTDIRKMERIYSFLKKKSPEWFTEKSPWTEEELYCRARESLVSGGSDRYQWYFDSYFRAEMDFDNPFIDM